MSLSLIWNFVADLEHGGWRSLDGVGVSQCQDVGAQKWTKPGGSGADHDYRAGPD